jgi:hypothetical protein
MLDLEGERCKTFDLLKDEEDLYLVGLREIVLGEVFFSAAFDAGWPRIEDNCFWEGFLGLRDREDFNREGEERPFSEA